MRTKLGRAISVVVVVAYLPQVTGCTATKKLPVPAPAPAFTEAIVGVTTVEGTEIGFSGSTQLVGDSLVASHADTVVRFARSDLQKIWVKRVDPALTTLAVIGSLALVAGIAGGIALAAKESCPFVYSWDGKQYVFDAEPYGGAITRGLERDDYGELEHARADAGFYRFLVTNEVNESQMTNQMELWVVDHAPGTRVVADEHGGLHTIARPVPPTHVSDQVGRDVTAWFVAADRLIWESPPMPDSSGGLRDELVLTFPRPRTTEAARLVAKVGTGLWGSHMLREMLQVRGSAVDEWYADVDGSPAAADSLRAWAVREETYGLRVDLDEGGTWRTIAVLPGGGPFITEQRLVPLDLQRVRGETVRLRVRPPRGFWALDAFALDYGVDERVQVDTIPVAYANDRDRGDVRSALLEVDDQYHPLPNTGDHAELRFPAPPARPGLARTLLLHSRGYYRLKLPAEGPPDVALIDSILHAPGGVIRFSAETYPRWRAGSAQASRSPVR